VIGPWRTDYGFLFAGAKKHGDARFVWIETAALIVYFGGLALFNWQGALLFLLPLAYLDHAATYAHNYLEHHRATRPGTKLQGAVSSYGRLYNLLCCNNGHHQEHHYRPQVHWTRLPELRALMLPEHERRVVPYAHLFNFGGAETQVTVPHGEPATAVR
jgi:fatty acid desaturase